LNCQGDQQEEYAHIAGGDKNLSATNTLVDILVDNMPNENIAKTTHRCLYFTSEIKISPELDSLEANSPRPLI
jgi:hypothetical protein